jgi:hypothetical protein
MVANCLARFSGNENLLLEDITSGLLCHYDDSLIRLGRKPNSISFHMRNLRAIYNKAIRRGLVAVPAENLFANVHTGVYQTRKRALSKEEMRALSELTGNLPEDDEMETIRTNGIPRTSRASRTSRAAETIDVIDTVALEPVISVETAAITTTTAADTTATATAAATATATVVKKQRQALSEVLYRSLLYFLFCFHARGMAFIDLAFLKKSTICDGYIHYSRQKTGKFLSVKINSCMQKILGYFSSMVTDSPYLFPIIHPAKGNERKQYETALALQNRRLKILGRIAGIPKLITTHVARHSWATIAKMKHVPLAVISDCLGHRDEKTTSIYLDSFESSVMDEASELVSNAIC